MCNSPAEPGPGGAPAGVAVEAPVRRTRDGVHDVESVGAAVIVRADGPPRAAGVFHFDPDVVLVDFGAEDELAAVAGRAVHDGIGGKFRRDQDRIVGSGAAAEEFGERGPGVPDLDGLGGVGTGVAAHARCRGCRGNCLSPGRVFVFPSLSGEGYLGNGIGPDAH